MSFEIPESYRTGRAAFLTAAANRSLDTITRVHPTAEGRDGKALFLDTVWLGQRDAKRALMLIAGTHGVEGYFGSAVLTALLRDGAFQPPPDSKIVLVHALNPYGFSWDRRTDENNVDVNRNFVDFSHPPTNLAYDVIADSLSLRDLGAEAHTDADKALMAAAQNLGPDILRRAIARGQYTHPTGLLYGGAAPSWSHKALLDILQEELRGMETLTAIDLHTGLGEAGVCSILSDEPATSPDFARTQAVWPKAQSCQADDTLCPPTDGTLCLALAAARPGTLAVTAEVGTIPLPAIFRALRRDTWLHGHGGAAHPLASIVAAEMRAAFTPGTPEEQKKAWKGTEKAVRAMLTAI